MIPSISNGHSSLPADDGFPNESVFKLSAKISHKTLSLGDTLTIKAWLKNDSPVSYEIRTGLLRSGEEIVDERICISFSRRGIPHANILGPAITTTFEANETYSRTDTFVVTEEGVYILRICVSFTISLEDGAQRCYQIDLPDTRYAIKSA